MYGCQIIPAFLSSLTRHVNQRVICWFYLSYNEFNKTRQTLTSKFELCWKLRLKIKSILAEKKKNNQWKWNATEINKAHTNTIVYFSLMLYIIQKKWFLFKLACGPELESEFPKSSLPKMMFIYNYFTWANPFCSKCNDAWITFFYQHYEEIIMMVDIDSRDQGLCLLLVLYITKHCERKSRKTIKGPCRCMPVLLYKYDHSSSDWLCLRHSKVECMP